MDETSCNTTLTLGPAGGARRHLAAGKKAPPVHFHVLFPTLPEGPSTEEDFWPPPKKTKTTKEEEEGDETGGAAARKKLRLSKHQSALLEKTFKERSTLTPIQKQQLADSLNLRPRQVEVWFQNRRARTKLKQTEMDCEILKKYCENLADENRRLVNEIQQLKTAKIVRSSICPFCQRIAAKEEGHVSPRLYGCAMKGSSMAC